MNIIFLDIDGVLHGGHDYKVDERKQVYKRINILSEIVKENNCKVVIEGPIKETFDEDTLETDVIWLKEYLNIFKDLGIEVIDKTPICFKRLSSSLILPIWKEDEIISYLKNHQDVEHFCIIDCDYLGVLKSKSDLDKVREYLLSPVYISESKNPNDEGLLKEHKDEVKRILKKDNKFCKKNK